MIDITDDTQNSADSLHEPGHHANAGSNILREAMLLTSNKPTKSATNKKLQGSNNPVGKFIKDLHTPVQIAGIAQLYGLDALKLEAQAQCEGGDRESRIAQADLAALQGIVNYLNKQRSTSIRWIGSEFLVAIGRIPCRILTIEQQRFEELHRGNHRCSHLYTNYKQGTIYRCPLPECGGATMNQKGIKRAITAHHKTSHRDLQQIQFTFKIEMARGWGYLSVPQRTELGGSAQGAVSTQDQSEGSVHWSRDVPKSQELDGEVDTECQRAKKTSGQ